MNSIWYKRLQLTSGKGSMCSVCFVRLSDFLSSSGPNSRFSLLYRVIMWFYTVWDMQSCNNCKQPQGPTARKKRVPLPLPEVVGALTGLSESHSKQGLLNCLEAPWAKQCSAPLHLHNHAELKCKLSIK